MQLQKTHRSALDFPVSIAPRSGAPTLPSHLRRRRCLAGETQHTSGEDWVYQAEEVEWFAECTLNAPPPRSHYPLARRPNHIAALVALGSLLAIALTGWFVLL